MASLLSTAYRNERVLITGHTGFKGSWLTMWLQDLGANVTGFALSAEDRSLFHAAGVESLCEHIEGDVRDLQHVAATIERVRPRYVFHLAAQSLVRKSYREPLRTFATNVQGTVNVLEAMRRADWPCAVVIVTSDKVYENDGRSTPYTEDDRLGGSDPYSSSKAASEIVTQSYRKSFFFNHESIAVGSARAGNAIGGGDWNEDRLVPDCIRALERGEVISIRNPHSVRPWQHLLDPLAGYLLLGARLAEGEAVREAWNFGPDPSSVRSVADVVESIINAWGSGAWVGSTNEHAPRESVFLALSSEKARARLRWLPRWGFQDAIARTTEWYRLATRGATPRDLADLCRKQIAEYSV